MMWSSILGLPDTILRQSVAEARLGEAETRRATQAFHRASGHGQMTKQVFVHSVVRELLPNFPTALAERLFGCINVDLSGTLKYKEFISTVCVLKVGTPREQLKLVFRVLDSTESGYITRKDVRTMLSWVIPTSVDIVDLVDGGGGEAWTAATFESTLFAKAEKLKWETFRVRMMSSGGSICAGGLTLVSWVHALGAAMTFQEHSLPTTPVASAALLPSNELTTTPSTLHVLGLYHAPTTLYPEKMAALHNGFHHLHGLYGHGVGVPKDILHDTFVRSSVFPAYVNMRISLSYLDSFNMDNGQSQNNTINLAPTLRDWMLHLAFAAHESMLEGLRCLFDLFADSQTVNHPTSAAASVDGHVSDLTELLYHVVPSPTYLLHAHVILHTHVAPPPLAQHISRWVDQLLVACDTVTFADFCGWLSSEQPDLLHALHECCDMVHVRLLGAAVQPATAIEIVHGLLQVYHPTTNPGVPGQEWFRVDRAMMWTPFLALDDSHMLAAKLPTNNGDFHRHDDINDEVFVNRATYDALCRFYAIMCAECRTHGRNSFAPVEPLTAAAVRVTNDQRQLESKVYTITILAEATTDAAAAGPANGDVGSR
ncbi:hypothetical protein AaE_008562 [Aphanomyces astaci]|uniref:EF-hand domain-containing protein n=1 Tax=Aphanomyces astaci TaxID=112090 RepID=A0A6A4ZUK7_APHAT|nr:hypothetical protein AaE_008562 [Aphanomyces astaci]